MRPPPPAVRPGVKGVTTPMDIANAISKGLAKKVVVAKVDTATWDMLRPLEGDCALQLLSFEDPEGKEVRRGGGSSSAGAAALALGGRPGALCACLHLWGWVSASSASGRRSASSPAARPPASPRRLFGTRVRTCWARRWS